MPKGQYGAPRGRKGLDGKRGSGPSRGFSVKLTDEQRALLARWREEMGARGDSEVLRTLIDEEAGRRVDEMGARQEGMTMNHRNTTWFIFDVESIGLHGEGFAVGWVVFRGGREVEAACIWTDPDNASGQGWDDGDAEANTGRGRISENIPSLPAVGRVQSPRAVREAFWNSWLRWKAEGAVMAAEIAWPVEARFLIACVNENPSGRTWQGPYPLIDIASVRLAAGIDPLGAAVRREDEPEHNPLGDARQSARLLMEALVKCGGNC